MNINAKVEFSYIDYKHENKTRTITIPFVCSDEFFTDVNETLSKHTVDCKLVKDESKG